MTSSLGRAVTEELSCAGILQSKYANEQLLCNNPQLMRCNVKRFTQATGKMCFHTELHKHILQRSPGYYKRFMLNSFLDMLCALYTLLNNYNKKRQGQIVSICASVGYCACTFA